MRFLPTLPSSTSLAFFHVFLLAGSGSRIAGSSASSRHSLVAPNNSNSNNNLRRLPPSRLAFVTAPSRTSLSSRPIGIPRGIIMHASTSNENTGNNDNEQQLPASGSFFYEVPPPKENNSSNDDNAAPAIEGTISESVTSMSSASFTNEAGFGDGDLTMFQQIIRKTKLSTSGNGFAKTTSTSDYTSPSIIRTTRTDTSTGDRESFVGIGMPLNDVNKPEYDADGYTLYADEITGEKRRVFEALVEYPSVFKMKIVGSDGVEEQDEFAPSIVKVVAESCGVDVSAVRHSIRKNGKWISVTVHAPVQNADMLYSLYENVDKDKRVKFKF